MNTKEKSRPRRQPGAGQVETATGQASISIFDCTTGGADRQPGFIEGLLSHGTENGLTLKDLERITDWPGRTIRKAIEAERRAGALIISDNKSGYFLTDDPAEVQRFARSMLHRSRKIARTARMIEKAAGLTGNGSLEGQEALF